MAPRGEVSIAVHEQFGIQIIGTYGSTEAGFPIVNRRMDRATAHLAGWLRPGYEARIADNGELWIRPPAPEVMFSGYVGGTPAEEWYATGDVMTRRDDGSFEFVDRRRDTIRRFGENISATAVEAVVVTDPAVVECAALAVPSPVSGQEMLLVVVGEVEPTELYRRLVPRLPRHALPRSSGFGRTCPRPPRARSASTRSASARTTGTHRGARCQTERMHSLVIRGSTIVDGTGAPRCTATSPSTTG